MYYICFCWPNAADRTPASIENQSNVLFWDQRPSDWCKCKTQSADFIQTSDQRIDQLVCYCCTCLQARKHCWCSSSTCYRSSLLNVSLTGSSERQFNMATCYRRIIPPKANLLPALSRESAITATLSTHRELTKKSKKLENNLSTSVGSTSQIVWSAAMLPTKSDIQPHRSDLKRAVSIGS